MRIRDAGEVALGMMGLYGLVQAALQLPFLIYILYGWFADPGVAAYGRLNPREEVSHLAQFAAFLVVGILLVRLAGRIAGWLLKTDAALSFGEQELRIVSREGFRFCLKLIGVYALFIGAVMLAQGITGGFMVWGEGTSRSWFAFTVMYTFAPAAATLALGAYLIRGGDWLVRFAWGKPEEPGA